jgi:poly(3-hydroxybutyrate) depolymerase
MKTSLRLITIFMALLAVSAGSAYGQQIVKNKINSENKERAYYLFVPQPADKTRKMPLIVMLHGSGRTGNVLIEHWQKLALQEGIILAGPDSRSTRSWSVPEDGPQFIYDLVEELKAKHPVDPRRVYLFGHSAGAIFGLFMSVLEPNYFAAAAVSAGAMKKENYGLLDEPERKIPVALFVGTKDPLFPLAEVRKTRDAFAERGYPVELVEISGLDHNYYSRSGEINAKAWEFLKKHELAQDPQYTKHNFRKN